jgi:hypothetical protein
MNYRKLYIEYLLKNTEDMNTYTYSCYCEKDNIFCYLWKFFLLMAKENKNQMAVANRTENNSMEMVLQAVGQIVNNRQNRGLGVRFSNREAIDTVCKAIQVNVSESATDEQKKVAALFATEIALNSDTAGEEMQRAIEAMQVGLL